MDDIRLNVMGADAVGFDTETHMIQPGLVAPPLVCGSVAIQVGEELRGQLVDKADARTMWSELLADPRRTICGANIAYDVLVMATDAARRGIDIMPETFAAYDPGRSIVRGTCAGRVFDVQVAEALHAIANGLLGKDPRTGRDMLNPETGKRGRYSLRAVVDQVLGRDDAKVNDRFRTSYALLEHLPINEWPHEARTYPVDDAVNTLEVALAQAGIRKSCNSHVWFEVNVPVGEGYQKQMTCSRCQQLLVGDVSQHCKAKLRRRNLHDLSRQVYAALAGALGSAWGFKVDQAAVDALEAKHEAEHAGGVEPFKKVGIIRENGTENQNVVKYFVAIAYGSRKPCTVCFATGKVPSPATGGKTKINCEACDGTKLELTSDVPRTDGGGVGKSRDVLQESGDETLMAYAEHSEGAKIPRTYIPFLRGTDKEGVAHPGVPLTPRFNSLLETGRTSYDGVIQLMPRSGGVRECIVARPPIYDIVEVPDDYTLQPGEKRI